MQNSRQSLWITVRKWHNKLFTYAWGQFHCCKGLTLPWEAKGSHLRESALMRVFLDILTRKCLKDSALHLASSASSSVQMYHFTTSGINRWNLWCSYAKLRLRCHHRCESWRKIPFLSCFLLITQSEKIIIEFKFDGEKVASQQTKSKKAFPCFGEVKIRNADQLRWFHQIHYFYFPFNFTKYTFVLF